MQLRALVFDAYGTLFDVHSVAALCEKFWPGKGSSLSRLWRAKQLEYTWLRSLMGRYENFEKITSAALRHACAALDLGLGKNRERELMITYLALPLFRDARPALTEMKKMGIELAILSNGSLAMLKPLVARAGLENLIGKVLSVDPRRIYKPAPSVYKIATDSLGMSKASIGFVSSNCWDACGARSFGFHTFWINRSEAPVDALGILPQHVLADLSPLPRLMRSRIARRGSAAPRIR